MTTRRWGPWCTWALAGAIGVGGCATGVALTDAGAGVRRVTDAEKPSGCRLLGDVAIGVPPDGARPRTEEELVMLMRNKAGDAGGDHVVVDMTEERNAESERPHWIGRGRAYDCPEAEAAPREGTAGGEAEGAGGEAEGGDAEGQGVEEGSLEADLLGE